MSKHLEYTGENLALWVCYHLQKTVTCNDNKKPGVEPKLSGNMLSFDLRRVWL
jgi:hypothetical protein